MQHSSVMGDTVHSSKFYELVFFFRRCLARGVRPCALLQKQPRAITLLRILPCVMECLAPCTFLWYSCTLFVLTPAVTAVWFASASSSVYCTPFLQRALKLVLPATPAPLVRTCPLQVDWKPKGRGSKTGKSRSVPSLFDLCLDLLADNFDSVESLGCVRLTSLFFFF